MLTYEADLIDERLYAVDELIGHEESGTPFKVLWVPLTTLRNGVAPLYPEGLLELLDRADARPA